MIDRARHAASKLGHVADRALGVGQEPVHRVRRAVLGGQHLIGRRPAKLALDDRPAAAENQDQVLAVGLPAESKL